MQARDFGAVGLTYAASAHLFDNIDALNYPQAALALFQEEPAEARETLRRYLALPHDIPKTIAALQKEMREAASHLEFERAAELRDRIQRLQEQELALRG